MRIEWDQQDARRGFEARFGMLVRAVSGCLSPVYETARPTNPVLASAAPRTIAASR
jgi:hypothetical protein